MYRKSDELTLDILHACPDILTKIMRNANVESARVKHLLNVGLLEKRLVDSDGYSEKRPQVYVYFPTDEGLELLEDGA